MWNLKNKKKKVELIDTEDRLVLDRVRLVGGWWEKCVKGAKRYKLSVIK